METDRRQFFFILPSALSLGVATLVSGCGGELEHPQIREGVTPYEKNKDSFDAVKADYERALRKRGRVKKK